MAAIQSRPMCWYSRKENLSKNGTLAITWQVKGQISLIWTEQKHEKIEKNVKKKKDLDLKNRNIPEFRHWNQ